MVKTLNRGRSRETWYGIDGLCPTVHTGSLAPPDLPGHLQESFTPRSRKTAEEMLDTVGYKESSFNPCRHTKWNCVHRKYTSFSYTYGESDVTVSLWNEHEYTLPDIRPYLELDFESYPKPWLEDFSAHAESHFTLAVDDKASLLNFIIEMIQMCEGNIKTLKGFLEAIPKCIARYAEYLYRNPAKFWLAWNFAIKPTVSDLRKFATSLSRARKRMEWLRNHNRKDTLIKYRENEDETERTIWIPVSINEIPEDLSAPFYMLPLDNLGQCPKLYVVCKYSIRFRPSAFASVRFDIPDEFLVGDLGTGIVWSAMQGLYDPVDVAWEATPFSWLLDYFLSEKTKLERFKQFALSPLSPGTINQSMFTADVTFRGNIEWVMDWSHLGYPGESQKRWDAGDFQYRIYSRKPGLPKEGDWSLVVPRTWYQLSILLALVFSKRRRR